MTEQYKWLSAMRTSTSPSLLMTTERLRAPGWRSDTILKEFVSLNRAYHVIKILRWWAARHLGLSCTVYWVSNNKTTLAYDRLSWGFMPCNVMMILGLTNQDLSERCLVLSGTTRFDLNIVTDQMLGIQNEKIFYDRTNNMYLAYSLTQNPEYEEESKRLSFLTKHHDTVWDWICNGVTSYSYVDADGNEQEFPADPSD